MYNGQTERRSHSLISRPHSTNRGTGILEQEKSTNRGTGMLEQEKSTNRGTGMLEQESLQTATTIPKWHLAYSVREYEYA